MFQEKEADREDANNNFFDMVNLIRDGQMTATQPALATSDSTLMEIMNIDKYSLEDDGKYDLVVELLVSCAT